MLLLSRNCRVHSPPQHCVPPISKQHIRNLRVFCAAGKPDQEAGASPQEVAVSQALTAIGLSGTLAVSGAALCGINLFSLFHWERLQDLQLALELNSILIILDAALFLPNYSIPDDLLEPQQQHRGNKNPPWQDGQQQGQCLDMSAVSACSSWQPSSWGLMLAMLRSSLRSPRLQQLPLQVTSALLVGREGSKELLQRGFFVTALAGWLADRLYEADVGGLEGLVTLPGGVQGTVPELGLWAASLAATLLFAPSAYIAAEEAAESVSGAMLLRTDAGSAVAAAAAATAAGTAAAGRSWQRTSAASSNSSSSTGMDSMQPQQQPSSELIQQPTVTAAALAPAVDDQLPKGHEDDEDDDDEPLDPEVLEYRLVKVTQACLTSAPVQLAYRLTLAKELGRLMLANVVFVVTQQNLAASLTSSVVANALLLMYARVGQGQPEAQQQPGGGSSSSSSR